MRRVPRPPCGRSGYPLVVRPPTEYARRLVLEALGPEPASTQELYDRLGYPALLRAGLIDYRAFRRVLVELQDEGLAAGVDGEDGATCWTRT